MDVIVLFPGQGSQSVGMGQELCAQYPAAKSVFEAADDACGFSITELCAQGPMEELTATQNAQPAVTTMNLAVFAVLKEEGINPVAVAGHSLGEISANCAAGVFDVKTAVALTRKRGELMQSCADAHPGSMVAVIGLDMEVVDEVCRSVSEKTGQSVSVANFNSPQQVVITGESAAVEAATEELNAKGAKRTVVLKVSGPWHSTLMAQAQEDFGALLKETDMADPAVPVYANVDAAAKTDGSAVREALTAQVTGSVRWTQIIQEMRKAYPDAVFLECGPGKVIKGLLRQIDREATCLNIECPATLAKALEKLGV